MTETKPPGYTAEAWEYEQQTRERARTMTPERATELLPTYCNPWYFLNPGPHARCTTEEHFEVTEVWDTMPGHTCWYDALLRISRGEKTTP